MLPSSSKISRALEQTSLTSASEIGSHRLSCSICLWGFERWESARVSSASRVGVAATKERPEDGPIQIADHPRRCWEGGKGEECVPKLLRPSFASFVEAAARREAERKPTGGRLVWYKDACAEDPEGAEPKDERVELRVAPKAKVLAWSRG
jgi:hypothetical protein